MSASVSIPIAGFKDVYDVAGVEKALHELPASANEALRAVYEKMLRLGGQRFAVKPSGLPQMQTLFEELPKGIKLTVNQVYPTTLPLVSVPAKLLARLPMLPETLEYRLIDHYFLLRDRDANVIVDVLSNVYPTRNR